MSASWLTDWQGKPRKPRCDCDDSVRGDGGECNMPAPWIVTHEDETESYCCEYHRVERKYAKVRGVEGDRAEQVWLSRDLCRKILQQASQMSELAAEVRAAVRAAIRRGSSITICPCCFDRVCRIAGGTRVVLPAPAGARSTTEFDARNAATT